MTKRILIIFMLIVAATMLFITACNSSSVPGKSKVDSKYVGKYYSGNGIQVSIIELGPNGQITGIYDRVPMYTGTYTIDGNQLKVDITGDGTDDDTATITGDKIKDKDGTVFVKKTDQQLADDKAAEKKKAEEKQRQDDQKRAEEQKKAQDENEVTEIQYLQKDVQDVVDSYQLAKVQIDSCIRDYGHGYCGDESQEYEKQLITENAAEYNEAAKKAGQSFCRQHNMPVSYNPDGTPVM